MQAIKVPHSCLGPKSCTTAPPPPHTTCPPPRTSEKVGETQAFMVTLTKSEPLEATPPSTPPPGQLEEETETTCTLAVGTGALPDEEATCGQAGRQAG